MAALDTISRFVPVSMRYGHFRFYWLALLAGVTGHQMLLQFTLGWLMFDITGQAQHLAYLGIAISVPALLLNLLGGVLADRWEPKLLVATAQTVSATVVGLVGMLVLTEAVEVWHILAAAFIIGAIQAFDQPSRASIAPRLVRREHIVNAVALDSIVWNLVRVLAPALAGMIIARWNIYTSIFITAASFYLLAAVLTFLNVRPRPPAAGQFGRQIVDSLSFVRRNPVFLNIMLLTFCNSMFGMAYIYLMPVFAKEVLYVGAERIGWLLGASGIGSIVGTWFIGNLRHGSPKGHLILIGATVFGLGQILFTIAAWREQYEVAMAMLFVVGVANSLYLVGGLSTIQQLVPEQLRGRVMGLYGVTWSLSPMGMAQGGTVAQHIGAPWAVAIGGMVIIAMAGVTFLICPEIRSLRAGVTQTLERSAPRAAVAEGDDD